MIIFITKGHIFMINNDSNITNYDITILKNNIKKRMKELNITQTALASETGIHQPIISKVLSNKDGSCFTIPQLVAIAHTLKTSTDELLGTVPESTHEVENLSDIAKYLLKLNKIIPISFGKLAIPASSDEDGAYDSGTGFIPDYVKDYYAIYFQNKHIDKFIRNWQTVSSSIEDDECREEVLNAWETSKLKELKKYEARYDFLSAEEKGIQLCEKIQSMMDSYYYENIIPEALPENDLSLAIYWINQPHAFENYNSIEYNNLRKSVSTYIKWHKDLEESTTLPFD